MVDVDRMLRAGRWRRKALYDGLCPKCDTELELCEPAEAHENYAKVPKGDAWAKRCPNESCDFVFVQHGPGFKMTMP